MIASCRYAPSTTGHAHAGTLLGVATTIVMPKDAPQAKVERVPMLLADDSQGGTLLEIQTKESPANSPLLTAGGIADASTKERPHECWHPEEASKKASLHAAANQCVQIVRSEPLGRALADDK